MPHVHTPTKIFFPTKGTKFLNDTDSVQDMHVDRCSKLHKAYKGNNKAASLVKVTTVPLTMTY